MKNKITAKAVATIEGGEDEYKFGPNGGFTAILSTGSQDRDGDKLHRDEWLEPLPERLPLDMDHGMSVADTIGSFHPYFDGDVMKMDATFASTPKAQEVRTLIKEGHITGVSVAFMTDRSKKDGQPRRELLNAGVVAIPSNRDAIIMDSKSVDVKADKKPYGDVTYADPGYQSDGMHRYPINTPEHVRAAWSYIHQGRDRSKYSADQLSTIEGRIRSAAEKMGIKLSKSITISPEAKAAGGDAAMVQAIHDASAHLGAVCIQMVTDEDPTGASEGANKSISFITAHGDRVGFDSHAEARDFFTDMLKSIDDADAQGVTLVEVGSLGTKAADPDDDPKKLIAGIDAVLDEAIKLTADVDRTSLPEEVGQALDLLVGVEESVDTLMQIMGIYDPDEPTDEKSADKVDTKEPSIVIDVPEHLDIDKFKVALQEVLHPQSESPAEPPAEAAAASDEEPAPADEAAGEAAEEPVVDPNERAMQMLMALNQPLS